MEPLTEDGTILWTTLFELSRDGIVILRQDGSVYRANRRYADMLGYVWDRDCQFNREELLELLRTVDELGAQFETRQCRKDGTLIEVEVSNIDAVCRDQTLIICIVRDNSARKKTEEELKQSEERLQSIASQLPGALFQYRMTPDGARSIPYFSEGIVELGGLTQEELSGSDADPAMSHILPEDAAVVEARIQESAKGLSPLHTEFRIRHGDDVLRTVVNLVNKNIRNVDIHGRWGGEEFMVILPQTGLNAAREVAEKLRKAIADHHFNEIGTATASFGVAELAHKENSRALAQRVDEALYRAKDKGKNRVEV